MQTKLKFLGTWILGSLTIIAGCDKNPVGGTDPLDSTLTLVQAVIYTPQASSHYSESILTRLEKELVECGLNSSGSPDCLDTQFVASYSLYRSIKSETEEAKTSVGFIDTKDNSASFVLVLEQSKSIPKVFLSAGLYFAGSSESHDLATVINDYADGKLEKIADLTIPQADEQSLLAVLSTDTNYRRLYHLSENFLHKRDPSIKGKVLAGLKTTFSQSLNRMILSTSMRFWIYYETP